VQCPAPSQLPQAAASPPPAASFLNVRFGAVATAWQPDNTIGPTLNLALPCLAGEPCEYHHLPRSAPRLLGATGALWADAEKLFGLIIAPLDPGADPCTTTQRLYREIFAATRDAHLYRIWNYVPRINAVPAGRMEIYRDFCRGRSLAFEEAFGADFANALPAASAVGCAGDTLAVLFAGGRAAPRHWENPAQIPAYRYPADYGPRSPGFARATTITDEHAYISGTAAIKGHRSVAPGNLDAQLACTLDNLRLIGEACGFGPASTAARRSCKVYLRSAADLPRVQAALATNLLSPSDHVTYLRADICRAELDLEIELSLVPEA
jgi:chorismate lyase / 3-hydroxybenzoate synthase